MPNILVECKVLPGIFKTEYLISVQPDARFYVDRTDVRVTEQPRGNEAVSGKVLAYLVEYRQETAVIEMTGTPVGGGLRILVPKDITSAAAA